MCTLTRSAHPPDISLLHTKTTMDHCFSKISIYAFLSSSSRWRCCFPVRHRIASKTSLLKVLDTVDLYLPTHPPTNLLYPLLACPPHLPPPPPNPPNTVSNMPFWPPISLTNALHSTLLRHDIPVIRTDHPSPCSQPSTAQRAFLQNHEFEQYRRVDDKHERRTRIVLPKRPKKKKKRPSRIVIVEPADKSESASDSGSDSEGTLPEHPKIGAGVGIDIDIDIEIERKSRHHHRNAFSRASPRRDPRYCGVDVEDREPGRCRCRRQCQHRHRHRHRYRRHSADPYAGVDIEERRPRTSPGRGYERREGMSSPSSSSSPSPPERRVRFEGVEERSPRRCERSERDV